jgi:hypothetical protein
VPDLTGLWSWGVAAASWLGTNSGGLGLIVAAAALGVAIGGFRLTLQQLGKTLSAAEAAADATSRVSRQALRNRVLAVVPVMQNMVRQMDVAVLRGDADELVSLLNAWRDSAAEMRGLLPEDAANKQLHDNFGIAAALAADAIDALLVPTTELATPTKDARAAIKTAMELGAVLASRMQAQAIGGNQ